jgi:hypothetical protein
MTLFNDIAVSVDKTACALESFIWRVMLTVLQGCFGEVCLASDKELNGRSKSNPTTFKRFLTSAFINHVALVHITHKVTEWICMNTQWGWGGPFIYSVTNEQVLLHWLKRYDCCDHMPQGARFGAHRLRTWRQNSFKKFCIRRHSSGPTEIWAGNWDTVTALNLRRPCILRTPTDLRNTVCYGLCVCVCVCVTKEYGHRDEGMTPINGCDS